MSERAHRAPTSATVFAALGDETRLALLARLAAGPEQSITRLAADAPVSRQAITKHLHVLAEAGLVRNVRRGRENLYQLEPQRLAEARAALDRIARQWDDALARLKAFVEK